MYITCLSCKVVFDIDIEEEKSKMYDSDHNSEWNRNPNHCAFNGKEYVPAFICPVCKNEYFL